MITNIGHTTTNDCPPLLSRVKSLHYLLTINDYHLHLSRATRNQNTTLQNLMMKDLAKSHQIGNTKEARNGGFLKP